MQSASGHRRRKQLRPLLLSAAICPGVGQVANGERLKGLVLLLLSLGALAWLVLVPAHSLWRSLERQPPGPDPLELLRRAYGALTENATPLALAAVLLAWVWVYAAWDAYRNAPYEEA